MFTFEAKRQARINRPISFAANKQRTIDKWDRANDTSLDAHVRKFLNILVGQQATARRLQVVEEQQDEHLICRHEQLKLSILVRTRVLQDTCAHLQNQKMGIRGSK